MKYTLLNSPIKVPKQWKRYVIFIAVLTIIYWREYIYLRYHAAFQLDGPTNIMKMHRRVFTGPVHYYKSTCDCRKDTVRLRRTSGDYVATVFSDRNETLLKYRIDMEKFESSVLTCGLYNSLRRGPNQRVISYSLYGTNDFYYKYIKGLIQRIYDFYPGWTVRVHYDSSINQSVICDIECMRNENDPNRAYYDIVDFCNIEQMPYDLKNTWNASYMHGMTWRWLPIGDSFVDFVNSRDTDAWIHQRELDSVNVWMASNTVFHVMRGKISSLL